MKRILIYIRAWRRNRILRRLAELDLMLMEAQYGYEATLWEDEECVIDQLQTEMHRLEKKLSRLV